MKGLKNRSMEGLRELREKGLKSLKISGLKSLMVKPGESRTERMTDTKLEDLAQKREEIKKEIKKLNQEKKGIETRIHIIRKIEKERYEEITEFPWREEIFPPFPRKTRVKMPEIPEVKDSSLPEENSEFSVIQDNETKIRVKRTGKEPENGKPDEKITEEITCPTAQNTTSNSQEVIRPEIETGKKGEEKTFPEKEDKTKTVYPFSAEKLSENKVSSKDPSKDFSKDSIEMRKTENKNNPVASLLGGNFIEELLSGDDLNPEEEQGFMKYLQEPEIGELINELKDTRSLLARAKHPAG